MDKNERNFQTQNEQKIKQVSDLNENLKNSTALELNNEVSSETDNLFDEKSAETPQKCDKKRGETIKLSKGRIAVNAIAAIVSVACILFGAGCFYVDSLINKINYVEGEGTVVSFTVSETGETTSLPDPMFVGGLYHDQAITNILVLSIDDYREGDVGRSDSMILLSVDTRHKKIKMTSFMRDMFVQIPGVGSNRLNAAYSYGGAPLTVKTIENNFGVDIDRYMLIDYDAFEKIIDSVGGIYIDVTDEEAVYINEYSFRKDVVGGYQLLNGDLARSYSRIRKIGDDFQRTERQRTVMSAAINRLKSSNIATINSVLSEVLPLITTNLSKDEVLNLATNSLTYLNYPIEQMRVPEDGAYSDTTVMISGMEADVLRPDLKVNSDALVKFLYENDIPKFAN